MTATGQNFNMYQGDDAILHFTTFDENGNLLNINGGTLVWVLYSKPNNVIVLTKTTTSGITLTDPSVGNFDITLIPEDTLNLIGIFYHECELTDSFNHVSTIAVGLSKIYESEA